MIELELMLRIVGSTLGPLQPLKCAKADSPRKSVHPLWKSSIENYQAKLPKIDTPRELPYLPTYKELELASLTIDSTLGPLQSLKCTTSDSLRIISYTTCNKHPETRKTLF